eukprot:5793730-Amphidinium_carterae.1
MEDSCSPITDMSALAHDAFSNLQMCMLSAREKDENTAFNRSPPPLPEIFQCFLWPGLAKYGHLPYCHGQ